MTDKIRGYLTITVIEASGKNKDDNYAWDSANFDGFVKVELRGGVRNIKVSTRKQPVIGTGILWNEELTLEVLDNANELRVMLCKEKISTTTQRRGGAVIAACGIFVNDILDAVPIDKYFELFKPAAGGEGGFIRLGLDFTKEPKVQPGAVPYSSRTSADVLSNGSRASSFAAPVAASDTGASTGTTDTAAGPSKQQQQPQKQKKKKRQGLWIALPLVLAALAAAAGVVAKKLHDDKRKSETEGQAAGSQQGGTKSWVAFGATR